MTQELCIVQKAKETNKKQVNNFKHAFISTYNQGHRQVKSILSKYYYILKNYPYLGKDISD